MIQYINKVPSKIEYYEILQNVYNEVEVAELSNELDNTITAVCAYKGERLIGMGRVKKEGDYLCVEDLIVKLDAYKEEVQKTIIVNLIKQVNKLKLYDMTVRDCLDMYKTKTVGSVKVKDNYQNESLNEQRNMIFGA